MAAYTAVGVDVHRPVPSGLTVGLVKNGVDARSAPVVEYIKRAAVPIRIKFAELILSDQAVSDDASASPPERLPSSATAT